MNESEEFVSRSREAVKLVVVIPVILIIGYLVMETLFGHRCGSRERARRVSCASNMKQIGLAMIMYSGDNKGYFPPDLDHITPDDPEDVDDKYAFIAYGDVFFCPSTGNEATETEPYVHQAGYSDYLYFGDGLKDNHPDVETTAIAQEKAGNHLSGQKNEVPGYMEKLPVMR